MPRLSILIPCVGDCSEFENTLASVLQNRPDDCEILVAHARDYADPYGLSGEVCFLPVPQATSLVTLINAGCEAARSGIIHVLQCGLEVPEHWTDAAVEALSDPEIASAIPVVVHAKAPNRVKTAGVGYSSWGRRYCVSAGRRFDSVAAQAATAIGPTLAAGFYRRSWWRNVRWEESLGDTFADVQHALTLKRLGAKTVLVPQSVVHADAALDRSREPFTFRTAKAAEQLYWTHSKRSAPRATLVIRVLLMLVEAIVALPSLRAVSGIAGRLSALMSPNLATSYELRLAQIRDRITAEHNASAEGSTLAFPSQPKRRSPPISATKRRAA